MIRPDVFYCKFKIHFAVEKSDSTVCLEVKRCTLEVNSIGYFRDEPAEQRAALTETDSGPAGRGMLLGNLYDPDRRDREGAAQRRWPIQKQQG